MEAGVAHPPSSMVGGPLGVSGRLMVIFSVDSPGGGSNLPSADHRMTFGGFNHAFLIT